MSRKVMKHLNASKYITHNHTDVVSVRKDKFESWKMKGYVVIEEGDDIYLIGKKINKKTAAKADTNAG